MILTPKQIEMAAQSDLSMPILDADGVVLCTLGDMAETLDWYAGLAQEGADIDPIAYYESRCLYCDAWANEEHRPDCLHLRFRKLRGLE